LRRAGQISLAGVPSTDILNVGFRFLQEESTMKTMLAILAGLLFAGDKELDKIQGTWSLTSHEVNGKATPEADLKKMTITVSGDKASVKQGDQVVQAWTLKLDATKTPNTVDSMVTEGEGKGTTMLGIYELSGDTMKFCFDPAGKKRPTDFKGGPGLMSGTVKKAK
jgi:uncharacterized protein (TIGR03067 family)